MEYYKSTVYNKQLKQLHDLLASWEDDDMLKILLMLEASSNILDQSISFSKDNDQDNVYELSAIQSSIHNVTKFIAFGE